LEDVSKLLEDKKKQCEKLAPLSGMNNADANEKIYIPRTIISEDEPLENILTVQSFGFLAVKSHLEQAQ